MYSIAAERIFFRIIGIVNRNIISIPEGCFGCIRLFLLYKYDTIQLAEIFKLAAKLTVWDADKVLIVLFVDTAATFQARIPSNSLLGGSAHLPFCFVFRSAPLTFKPPCGGKRLHFPQSYRPAGSRTYDHEDRSNGSPHRQCCPLVEYICCTPPTSQRFLTTDPKRSGLVEHPDVASGNVVCSYAD